MKAWLDFFGFGAIIVGGFLFLYALSPWLKSDAQVAAERNSEALESKRPPQPHSAF